MTTAICESCRCARAGARVTFADGVSFEVCALCLAAGVDSPPPARPAGGAQVDGTRS